MSRSPRIEFAGALYHVMARGDARAAIFLSEENRQTFCAGLARVCERFDWRVWAYTAVDRDSAIRDAYASGSYTLKAIGEHFGLHYATVSRIARA